MLPDQRKLGSVDANHSKFINLAPLFEATWHAQLTRVLAYLAEPPKIEQR